MSTGSIETTSSAAIMLFSMPGCCSMAVIQCEERGDVRLPTPTSCVPGMAAATPATCTIHCKSVAVITQAADQQKALKEAEWVVVNCVLAGCCRLTGTTSKQLRYTQHVPRVYPSGQRPRFY